MRSDLLTLSHVSGDHTGQSGGPAGFPWLGIAGKTLAGWLVIDMDATLVTASSG